MVAVLDLLLWNLSPMEEPDSWNSSYVYTKDNASMWSGRHFFTYFTQLNARDNKSLSMELTLLLSLFVVGVFGNCSVLASIFRFKDLRSVTNYFVGNVSTADLLLIGSSPIVAFARTTASWVLGDITCKLVPYTQFVSAVVLIWTVTFISIDRYKCIVVPPYRSTITIRRTVQICLALWLLSSVLFIPILLWFQTITVDSSTTICTLIFPQSTVIPLSTFYVMPIVLIACVLPILTQLVLYQRIFNKMISTRGTWASSCVMVSSIEPRGVNVNGNTSRQGRRQSELSISDIFVPWTRRLSVTTSNGSNGRQGSLSQQEEVRVNRHIRVIRVLFLNVIFVIVMWSPIIIVLVLLYIDGTRPTKDTNFFMRSYHLLGALIIAYFNTIINPIIYGLLSDNFRAHLFFWKRNSQDASAPSTSRNNTMRNRGQNFETSET